MIPNGLRSKLSPSLLLASVSVLLLSGCGMGTLTTSSSSSSVLQGIAHGGPNPIVGATVTLYGTGNSGYGSNATVLGTTTTDGGGFFSFSGATPCTSPTQEYITVYGGDPGSGPNSSYLLMAALGDCSTINTGTNIWVDELSTVAAAYALSNFINISGDTVNVGAPTSSSQSTGNCGNAVNISTNPRSEQISTCTTGALAHAFANALNLVNAVSIGGVAPDGKAYTAPPSNANAEVPQALINTLGDVLVTCVNSTGAGSGTSACDQLFTYTTPAYTSNTPSNTLQAMVDLAKYPNNNANGIYGLLPPQVPYLPVLTSAPQDFSMGIVYKGTSVGGTQVSLGYPLALTLDANDDVFVAVTDSASPSKSGVAGFYANGGTLFPATYNTQWISPTGIAADNLGNVWVANNGASVGTTAAILQYSQSNGSYQALTGMGELPYGVAVDAHNNVWFTQDSDGISNLNEMVQGSNYSLANFTNQPVYSDTPYGIAIDSNQDIWTANGPPSTGDTLGVGFFANTGGSATSPAYANSVVDATSGSGNAQGTTIQGILQYAGLAVDPYNNVWVTIPSGAQSGYGMFVAQPSVSGRNGSVYDQVGFFGPYSGMGTSPVADVVDSNYAIWSANVSGSSSLIYEYLTTTGDSFQMSPCRITSGTTTCSTTAPSIYNPSSIAIDSTGSVWVTSPTDGLLVQIIGSAAPTWPLLAYGHPAVPPQ